MYQWIQLQNESQLKWDGQWILSIPAQNGCMDTFESLGEGAWKWVRKCIRPVDQMKMTVCHREKMTYWQVPSVNYNGNGWGSGAQYSGFSCNGEPWTYAWHRVAIPACTYAESGNWALGLFGEEKGGMSCSIWEEDGCARQALIWPEVEGPKVLSKRTWWPRYEGKMEPADSFTALLFVAPVKEIKLGYQDLLDFAWNYFDRPLAMERTPEELMKLDTLFFRGMWHRQIDGITGFAGGLNWDENYSAFMKRHMFEIGWVGQNASVACTLLREYLKSGDEDLRDKALSVLDSWVKYAVMDNGLMFVYLQHDPKHLASALSGNIPMVLDACNLGTAATYFFKAAKLAEKADCPRPEYEKTALGLCDFALRAQQESGELAKSWFLDGSIDSPHGSVGCFLVLPLFDAYQLTGEKKYLDAALKAFDFYYTEFHQSGVTTAGALDSFCIDKESAAPLLRCALRCHEMTGDEKYIAQAEEVAYYLATWQWHYTVHFPKDSLCAKIGYDTFGGTSVSAAHNAHDPYGLYYVPEYLKLAELTGKEIWRSRARALWYNGIQCISDGTLVVNGKVRPAGAQDESMRHTRWGRTDMRYFVPAEWFTVWPGAFRQVALDMMANWDELR